MIVCDVCGLACHAYFQCWHVFRLVFIITMAFGVQDYRYTGHKAQVKKTNYNKIVFDSFAFGRPISKRNLVKN